MQIRKHAILYKYFVALKKKNEKELLFRNIFFDEFDINY